jgi:hypothetical protein
LSRARNRAVAEARYGVVAFLDDDVDVDPDWLCAMAAAFAGGKCAAVGGRAFLLYPPGRKPSWLDDDTEGLLTRVECGSEPRRANADELFGLNLSIRKDWIERVGPFRTDLGRIGTCLLSSEEGEMLERIAKAGGVLLYEPGAVVGHRVPPDRLRRGWFWSRAYWGHRGDVRTLTAAQLSPYRFAQATWHLVLAAWELLRGVVSCRLTEAQLFQRTTRLVGRFGTWVGFAEHFLRCRLRRPDSSACAGADRANPRLSRHAPVAMTRPAA